MEQPGLEILDEILRECEAARWSGSFEELMPEADEAVVEELLCEGRVPAPIGAVVPRAGNGLTRVSKVRYLKKLKELAQTKNAALHIRVDATRYTALQVAAFVPVPADWERVVKGDAKSNVLYGLDARREKKLSDNDKQFAEQMRAYILNNDKVVVKTALHGLCDEQMRKKIMLLHTSVRNRACKAHTQRQSMAALQA